MLTLAQVQSVATPEQIAEGNFHDLAALVNSGLTKISNKEIGDGALSLALGPVDGPVFMYKLRKIAATDLPIDATPEQIVPVAIAQQAVASLAKQGFDVGDAGVRAGIDMMVGVLLTQAQADTIKELAEVPYSVTWEQVRAAVQENA